VRHDVIIVTNRKKQKQGKHGITQTAVAMKNIRTIRYWRLRDSIFGISAKDGKYDTR
jgi:hypothetical protein